MGRRAGRLGSLPVMAWAPDSSAMVLLVLTVACALLVVEVALPTFGIAGGAALLLGAVGVAVLAEQSLPWWPLLLVALAVTIWAAVLLAWVPSLPGQVAAASAFAAGAVSYGALVGSAPTIVLAAAGAVALPLGFRPLLRATHELVELAPKLGMESLLHRRATVVRWSCGRGTVRLDGSLWNATSTAPLQPGAEVVVVDVVGMTLDVAQRAPSAP